MNTYGFKNPNGKTLPHTPTNKLRCIANRFLQYSLEKREEGLCIGGYKLRQHSYNSAYIVISGDYWSDVLFFDIPTS